MRIFGFRKNKSYELQAPACVITSSRIASRVVNIRNSPICVTRQKQTGRTFPIVSAQTIADA